MNVVIYRLPLMLTGAGEDGDVFSLSWPPSHCPVCHSRIRWYDNIPLFSWLLLRGKCRACRTPVSPVYLLTEALTGFWFAGVYLFLAEMPHGVTPVMDMMVVAHFLPPLVLFCFLYCITFIDIRHYLIPDGLSLGLLWSGLVFSVLGLIPVTPFRSVMGAVLAWCVIFAVQKSYRFLRGHEGLGGGDVKLFAAASVWLGITQVPWLILYSAVCGGVLFGIQRFCQGPVFGKGRAERTAEQAPDWQESGVCRCYIPFGPAIVVATLILFFIPVR
ncbi:TPA: prepilin peptidase [Klebsiella oxytoca]|uniref:Prepilin leader peptidase/N-methyltransferase n=1 Tax=Klebsiella oxytoca TaxID=571 RepID=A0AAN5RDR0_KLEOX|nr:prepilin peptidase [Klebsiella oxytoca]